MTIHEWVLAANSLLDQLKMIDLGYPLGSNEIRGPEQPSVVDDLLQLIGLSRFPYVTDFYRHCDGISWPDVHSGYWILKIKHLAHFDPVSEPNVVTGLFAGNVTVIGSNGGGESFALAKESGAILYLPHGPVHGGVYDDYDGRVKQVAPDFQRFLERLLSDLAAFVKGVRGHSFIY